VPITVVMSAASIEPITLVAEACGNRGCRLKIPTCLLIYMYTTLNGLTLD